MRSRSFIIAISVAVVTVTAVNAWRLGFIVAPTPATVPLRSPSAVPQLNGTLSPTPSPTSSPDDEPRTGIDPFEVDRFTEFEESVAPVVREAGWDDLQRESVSIAQCLRDGDQDAAERCARESLARHPSSVHLRGLLATVLTLRNKTSQAQLLLRQALHVLRQGPQQRDIRLRRRLLLNLLSVDIRIGDAAAVERDCRDDIDATPRDWLAPWFLGRLLVQQGDPQGAARVYEAYLRTQRGRALRFHTAYTRFLLLELQARFPSASRRTLDDTDRLVAEAGRRLRRDGRVQLEMSALLLQGDLHLRRGEIVQARACYRGILELQAQHGDLFAGRARQGVREAAEAQRRLQATEGLSQPR